MYLSTDKYTPSSNQLKIPLGIETSIWESHPIVSKYRSNQLKIPLGIETPTPIAVSLDL